MLMFLTSGILRESGTGSGGQCLRLYNREVKGRTPHLTLEIKLVAAISGFREGTLVNGSLSVLGVTAPGSADQEPVGNSMSSSRKQRRGERESCRIGEMPQTLFYSVC